MSTLKSISVLAMFVTAGCAPDFSHVELEPLSTPPVPVSVRGSRVEMPAGVAVVVEAQLQSDNSRPYDDSFQLDLLSQDRVVFTTYPREEERQFVLVGINPGETCMDVVIDGDAEGCVPVMITQPAL
jgi:hypothetical protein